VKNSVPVFEDKPLAKILFKLNIGQEIPEILYKAVATILANVYKLKKQKTEHRPQRTDIVNLLSVFCLLTSVFWSNYAR
jgi:flagellar biosynthesis protein FlhB